MPSDRQLAATVTEAMLQWDRQKADGVSLSERVGFLEKILRLSWPFTREWKYLCARCDDTGLVINQCPGDARCGSRWGERAHPAHDYGTPCWCSAGAKFSPKTKTEDDYAEAGRVSKKPTRLGR